MDGNDPYDKQAEVKEEIVFEDAPLGPLDMRAPDMREPAPRRDSRPDRLVGNSPKKSESDLTTRVKPNVSEGGRGGGPQEKRLRPEANAKSSARGASSSSPSAQPMSLTAAIHILIDFCIYFTTVRSKDSKRLISQNDKRVSPRNATDLLTTRLYI